MPLESSPSVFLKKEPGLNIITISNGVNNAISNQGLREMLMAFADALVDNSNPIMITGSGEKSFSMGYTANCTKISDKVHLEEAYHLGTSVARAILRSQVPVMAAVNGYALGLGLEIVLCCDFVVASPKAKFGMPEIKYGIPSLTGFIPELTEKFSGSLYSRVKSGDIFGAEVAKQLGLITSLLPLPGFYRHARAYAMKLKTDLVRMIKPKEKVDLYRTSIDNKFFSLYDPTCSTMMELERFRNSI